MINEIFYQRTIDYRYIFVCLHHQSAGQGSIEVSSSSDSVSVWHALSKAM